MSELYSHCTHCGGELSEELSKRYRTRQESDPVLCKLCLVEEFPNNTDVMELAIEMLTDEFNEALQTVAQQEES